MGKHGLVTDPAVHEAVIERVTAEAEASRLVRVAMTPSPITGATGNREFFLHLRVRQVAGVDRPMGLDPLPGLDLPDLPDLPYY